MVISEARDTHTYYRAFNSGTVTTYFKGLGMSRPGFEYPSSRMRCEHSQRLRHQRLYRDCILPTTMDI